MTEKKITTSNRLHLASQIQESLEEPANTTYYVFAAKHTAYPEGDSTIESPKDTESYMNSIYNEMVFGKRVAPSDVSLLIPRNDWESNTIFTQFDDTDDDLLSKNFYTIVNAASFHHVYKCLYNNEGMASTIEPSFDAVSESDPYYETSDGYIWKYMYSVNNTIVDKFATSSWFPIQPNTSVEENARVGAIDLIVVEDGGNNYSNYLSGTNQFSGGDFNLDGNNLIFDISSNSAASTSNGFYNGCYIYIKSGDDAEAGQYKKIVNYYVNSTAKAIVLESAFANSPGLSATFDIYPSVTIISDGGQTTNAAARAIVNTSSNTIQRIDMLDNGTGYRTATASIDVPPILDVKNATLRTVISPYNGHGSNSAIELGATAMGMTVSFSNNESNTIPQSNDYRTIGILKDPVFDNVVLTLESKSGVFLNGERIYKIEPRRMGLNAIVDSTTTTVISGDSDFTSQFDDGDKIFLTYMVSESSGNTSMLATVESITNSSSLELTSNASFTHPDVYYYRPRTSTTCEVVTSNTTSVTVSNMVGVVETGDLIVGETSGALGTVTTVMRGGVAKGFSTFVNAHKYVGTVISGEFIEDELVTQGESSAKLHSVVSNTNFYVTNQFGNFVMGSAVIGQTSGAVASFTEAYDPELKFRSGEIMYMENLDPIERDPEQSETFKLIFEF